MCGRAVRSIGTRSAHNRHGKAMTKYISEQEEQRGTRGIMMGAFVLAIIACAGLVWVFLPSFNQSPRLTTATGERTDQPQGHSVAGKNTAPPRLASHKDVNPAYIGRAHQIESTGTDTTGLKPAQQDAIKSFVAQNAQQRVDTVNFPIAVGAAVPSSFQLHSLPPKLAEAMPSYQGDQYFMVPHQLVIVEKKTRRIVAIVPA